MSGPGQHASASAAAAGGTAAAQSGHRGRRGHVDDERVVGRAALHAVDGAAPPRGSTRPPPARRRSRWGTRRARRPAAPRRAALGRDVGCGHRSPLRPLGPFARSARSPGTASRNPSMASMKANDSGVAKWSTLRSETSLASGSAAARRSPGAGEVAVAEHHQDGAGDRRQLRLRERGGPALEHRGQGLRVVARLLGVVPEGLRAHVAVGRLAPHARRSGGRSPPRPARTRRRRSRPARSGRSAPAARSPAPAACGRRARSRRRRPLPRRAGRRPAAAVRSA